MTAHAAGEVFEQQRAERRSVRAVLLNDVPRGVTAIGGTTPAPTGSTEAAIESGFLATAAATALAGLVVGAGAVARWRLDRRRIDGWDREWDLVGPRWGHKTG